MQNSPLRLEIYKGFSFSEEICLCCKDDQGSSLPQLDSERCFGVNRKAQARAEDERSE